MSVHKIKNGRPTYLNPDEEALVVAAADMEGAHGLPIDVRTLGAELQMVIGAVNARQSTKVITPHASSQYTLLVIMTFFTFVYSLDDQEGVLG